METITTTQNYIAMENFISEMSIADQPKRVLLALWTVLEEKSPQDFVRLHQDCFKDHYLTWDSKRNETAHRKGWSELNDTDFIMEQLGVDINDDMLADSIFDTIFETIKEKYVEFTKGLEDVVAWYDSSHYDEMTEDDILFACDLIDYDDYRKIVIDRSEVKGEQRDKKICELLQEEYTPDYENEEYDEIVEQEIEFSRDYIGEVYYEFVSGHWYRHLLLRTYEEIKERL